MIIVVITMISFFFLTPPVYSLNAGLVYLSLFHFSIQLFLSLWVKTETSTLKNVCCWDS